MLTLNHITNMPDMVAYEMLKEKRAEKHVVFNVDPRIRFVVSPLDFHSGPTCEGLADGGFVAFPVSRRNIPLPSRHSLVFVLCLTLTE